MTYLWVKWVHILASTLLFGTGLGIAFFMWLAHLRGDPRVIASTARTVVIADACFTAPAVVVQLATGWWLTRLLGLPLDIFWVKAALVLFFVIGACWLPVLWLQIRARDLAMQAVASSQPLPPAYYRAMRVWFWLGWPAFLSVIAIFWLMVMKPA
ncbi:DUF2269 domain-containing protein [Pseudoxanthomonas sp. Root630]|uniref:DUF2269 family protein n=1 Tax=Pseudoxanthomonas sp. Root630 TaxID=1736574 RepID=UPI0007036706|nr:DUF2269 domain-containing protein [Pseudoxanthomonas sp. Root630]KRA46367.1 hypothetical protein ASD72_03930 [Pseudoxanthomonas sp. Root630]